MKDSDWEIIDGKFEPWAPGSASRVGPTRSAPESLFALSNGYLGVRGAPEEGGGSPGAFVNGYFERTPIVYGEAAYGYARFHETIVNLPDGANLGFELNGFVLGRDGRVLSEGRRLDLRRGVLERSLSWEAPDGRVVRLFSERFVSLSRPTLAAFRVRLRLSGKTGKAAIRTEIKTQPANKETQEDPRVGAKFQEAPYRVERTFAEGSRASASIRAKSSGLALSVASSCGVVRLSGPSTKQPGLTPRAAKKGNDSFPTVQTSFQSELSEGDEIVATKYLSYRRDEACGAAWTEAGAEAGANENSGLEHLALADVEEFSRLGFDNLLDEHAIVLKRFWATCGLEIDAPEGLAAALRFNIFHVFQAAGRDSRTNIPAKGLTGEGYEGHTFWDTEIYLLPLLTYTAPDIAAALARNRAAILDLARERAREMGHARGALFPWRTISGRETSAYYPAGSAQYHIDADVAYAVLRYSRAAGDREFLAGPGAEILAETARLWLDAGHYGRDGRFRIDEVTGPDEYSALVNNNAYTNILARANLRAAARVVRRLESEAPDAYARLRENLGLLPEEPQAWQTAADCMYLPYDEAAGIIPQDDSFMDREPWDFAGTPASKHPLLLHFHPLAIYRKQVLKQPDLLLAMVLRPSEFSLAEKKRNYDFYEPLTTGDSSLSHCAMSIAAAEAGYSEKAWAYFLKTVRLDLDDTHGNSSHGVHIAAMGGSWSSLVYGFAGFQDDGDVYSFSPRLPPAIKSLSFRLRLGGGTLAVALTGYAAEYRWDGPGPLTLRQNHEKAVLQRGGTKGFDLRPAFRAAVFDLDGVLADTAVLHTKAWKRLSEEEGFEFPKEVQERLKGRSRMESLEILLGDRAAGFSKTEKEILAGRKNSYYKELVSALTPSDALPGALRLLSELRALGVKIGLASASRNAQEVLSRLHMTEYFDAVADAARARPKPDPEIFLAAAEALRVCPRDCVGIEDAQAGIEAIRRAGMKAIGVGSRLFGADRTIASLDEIKTETLFDLVARP